MQTRIDEDDDEVLFEDSVLAEMNRLLVCKYGKDWYKCDGVKRRKRKRGRRVRR